MGVNDGNFVRREGHGTSTTFRLTQFTYIKYFCSVKIQDGDS